MLLNPVVVVLPAHVPRKILSLPEVMFRAALHPIPMFLSPVVVPDPKEYRPIATL